MITTSRWAYYKHYHDHKKMTDHFLKIMIMLITSVFINMFLYFDLTTPVAPPPSPPPMTKILIFMSLMEPPRS